MRDTEDFLRDGEAPEAPDTSRDGSPKICGNGVSRSAAGGTRPPRTRPREAAHAGREDGRLPDLEEPRRDEERGHETAAGERSRAAEAMGGAAQRARPARTSAIAARAGPPPRTRSAERGRRRARRGPPRVAGGAGARDGPEQPRTHARVVAAFRNAAEERTKPERPQANAPRERPRDRTSVRMKRNAPRRPRAGAGGAGRRATWVRSETDTRGRGSDCRGRPDRTRPRGSSAQVESRRERAEALRRRDVPVGRNGRARERSRCEKGPPPQEQARGERARRDAARSREEASSASPFVHLVTRHDPEDREAVDARAAEADLRGVVEVARDDRDLASASPSRCRRR